MSLKITWGKVMPVKVEPYGTQNQYIVGTDGFSSPKYAVGKENVKKFAEEYNSINTVKTAQNAAVTGVIGTLSVIGAMKYAKKVPIIAKIPLTFLAFCAASMLAFLPNNWFANKKMDDAAKKYGAQKI